MPGLDESVPERTAPSIAGQIVSIARLALTGRRGLGIATALAIVITAGVVAPGSAPGAWVWLRVIAVTLLVGFALASIASTMDDGRHRNDTILPFLVWGSLLVGIAISLTFTVLTATLAILTLVLLLVQLSSGARQQGMVFWTVIVLVTPLWVWSAFDAWNNWLLMLVPVAAIGVVSLEHALRSGRAGDSEPRQAAAWIGLVSIGAGLLVLTLLNDIDPSWIIAGNVVLVVLAISDLLLTRQGRPKRLPAVWLPAVSLVTLTLAWLLAL